MTLSEFREREERWILACGTETFSELDEAEATRDRERRRGEYMDWYRSRLS